MLHGNRYCSIAIVLGLTCASGIAAQTPAAVKQDIGGRATGDSTVASLSRQSISDPLSAHASASENSIGFPIPKNALPTGAPDHVRVVSDQEGYPLVCEETGIYVRAMQMQIVDRNNNAVTEEETFIEETYNPGNPVNSCPTGAPKPTSCGETGSMWACPHCGPGQFLDVLTVSQKYCDSGMVQESGCGFRETATWSACSISGSKVLWTSPRETLSNGITVNDSRRQFRPGTQLH